MNRQWELYDHIEVSGGVCAMMEQPGSVLKSIALLIIFAMLWQFALPLAEAAEGASRRAITGIMDTHATTYMSPSQQRAAAPQPWAQPAKARVKSDEEHFSDTVASIEAKLGKLSDKLIKGEDEALEEEDLKKLEKKIKSLSAKLETKFTHEANDLKAKKLPQVILNRHTAMVTNYRKELNIMLGNIQAISSAANSAEKQQRAELAAKDLKKKQHHRPSTFDPANLPNSSEKPNKNNHPKTSEQAFNDAGFTSSPLARVAVNASFTYANLAGASDPAYLAATTEVTLTPAILAKATALNHDPVQIFNFVRNNVQWLPTWGAMQTADHTLDSLQGNAMDISSLTIALLRASGIPARYRHGTIDVLADRLMNWAGGFTDITAAADHASSGGIPVASVVRGGSIYKVRMEHVWVEAAIDYFPSRGAINKDADSWIAMDTSFKQYQFAPGMEIETIAPFDAYAFTQQYLQTMQIDAYGGMTSATDAYGQPTTAGQLLLQQAINDRQSALINHINTNDPYATVQDVIGGTIIPQEGWSHLPSSMQNATVTQGVSYGALPASLEYRISFQFNNVDAFGFPSTNGTPLTLPLPELNNQKVTVSFRPATPADEQVLTGLMAGVTDIYSLPTSIPAYLIKVIPELKLNGNLIMSGTAVQMGADQLLDYTIRYPDGRTRNYTSNFEAGTFHSVGIVGGSIAKSNLTKLQVRVSQLQTDLYAGITTGANKESILGDMFYAGTLGYFAMYNGLTKLQAQTANVSHLLMPSLGTYGTSAGVTYLFGFPRSLSMGGIVMDIGKLVSVTSTNDGNKDSRFTFVLQAGMLSSALEHTVPEQMFSTATQKVEAVSTVKLLSLAAQQGMPIYQINQANSAITIPKLQLSQTVINEIQVAVASGKEVIVHQSNITAFGWTGAGYAIVDPVTGDGAWRISGGVNGAAAVVMSLSMSVFVVLMIPAALAVLAAWAIPLLITLGVYLAALYVITKDWTLEDWSAFGDFFKPYVLFAGFFRLLAMATEAMSISFFFLFNFFASFFTSDTKQ